MPKPRYIICSLDRLVDRATGLSSHINVVDRMEFTVLGPQPESDDRKFVLPMMTMTSLVMTSVWMQTDQDEPGAVYDFEVAIVRADETRDILSGGEFSFEKRYHRIEAEIAITTHTKLRQSGIIWLESSIRQRGQDNWLTQAFPIEIDVRETSFVEATKQS